MNVNEVLSNRAIQLLGGELGSQQPVGPNDDVNMGQSSNDTLPDRDAHRRGVIELDERLHAASSTGSAKAIEAQGKEWMDVVKIGRTHLEDAVPLTVGQEWSGWAAQIRACIAEVERSREGLFELAARRHGRRHRAQRTAGVRARVAAKIAELTGKPFVTAPNKFAAQGSLDAMVRAHAALRGAGGRADEDRQRHALARFGPALRLRRADAARQRAGILDHAGQGQSDPVRGDGDGLPSR